jgi:hypothetical protein
MYRSKQRGFLELDLVLGTWVEQHIRSMDEANIRSLLQVLDLVSYPASTPPPLVDLACPLIALVCHFLLSHALD